MILEFKNKLNNDFSNFDEVYQKMLLEYKVSGIRLYDKENKLHLYDIIQFGTIKRNYLRLYVIYIELMIMC